MSQTGGIVEGHETWLLLPCMVLPSHTSQHILQPACATSFIMCFGCCPENCVTMLGHSLAMCVALQPMLSNRPTLVSHSEHRSFAQTRTAHGTTTGFLFVY